MPMTPRPAGRSLAALATIFIMLLACTAMPFVTSGASDGKWTVSKLDKKLPYPVYRASMVWTGERAYIFSGRTDASEVDSIIEFDPATGQSGIKNAKVPKARIMAAAAWLDPYAYIFGGSNMSTVLDDVVRYDPATDTIKEMPYKMPYNRVGLTAVSVGDSIVLMGGKNDTAYKTSVLRFYPGNGSFVKLQAPLIQGGGRTGVFSGDKVYLFGICPNAPNVTVLEVHPMNGTSLKLDVGPDRNFYWSSSAWTGISALIFGGDDYLVAMDEVLEFTPTTSGKGEVKTVGKLPQPIENSVAFYDTDNGKAYLLGGRGKTEGLKDILVFSRDGSASTEVTPERAFLVIGLMGFVVIVVAVQAQLKRRGQEKAEAPNGPRPVPPNQFAKVPDRDMKRRR